MPDRQLVNNKIDMSYCGLADDVICIDDTSNEGETVGDRARQAMGNELPLTADAPWSTRSLQKVRMSAPQTMTGYINGARYAGIQQPTITVASSGGVAASA